MADTFIAPRGPKTGDYGEERGEVNASAGMSGFRTMQVVGARDC